MPRARASVAASLASVRESPRKRKRSEPDIDEVTETSVQSRKPANRSSRTKSVAHAKSLATEFDTEDKQDQAQSESIAHAKEEDISVVSATKARGKTTKSKTVVTVVTKHDPDTAPATLPLGTDDEVDIQPAKKKSKASAKRPAPISNEQPGGSEDEQPKKVQRKRKTKEEKEAEAMPLAARTAGLNMYVGAHVSIAKGLENAVTNCMHIGGNAFALFLKSQRKWENPPLKDENKNAFRHHCSEHKYDAMSHVVPHGSYLVNLATPDKDKAKQSYDAFLDDLRRCEALGIKYYNFHPGATNKEPLPEAIGRLAGNLNRALSETSTVVPLLENMAGHGSIIGSRFSDLRDIIAKIEPQYKSRIGICIDTCHTFAAGYDLRSPAAFQRTFGELDDVVGLQYLKALHINDSKAPFDSKRDLHQNIGLGFLGLRAFHNVMNEPRLQNIPLILETPCDRPDPTDPTGKKTIDDKTVWAKEIKLLESLIGMDPESAEFKALEAELSEQGRAERVKMETSIAAREEKAQKKLEREIAKGQKSVKDMFAGKTSATKKRKGSISSTSSLSDLTDSQ